MQDSQHPAPSRALHGESLIDWFATLSPDQRLAELESRVAFFWSLRAVGDLLEEVLSRQKPDR